MTRSQGLGMESMTDERWMKRVLRLAAKGRGRTSPNPMVGAILVKQGKVVGQGYHAKAGAPHAEILALRQAGERSRGATLYINLEPCTHEGRTPPCAPRVVESRVKRVVIGMMDPNPLVRGKGVAHLQKEGIPVRVGVLKQQCQRMNEAFCKYIVKKEPFVVLKAALTLDGKVATRRGQSKWITGEASRRFGHRIRNEVDGILVGIGTILKDDPLLTARIQGGRDPYRIVLDSRLRIPEHAKVLRGSPPRVVVVTTRRGEREKRKRLERKGIRVLVAASKKGRVDIRHCLRGLGKLGMMSLLVEGGSQVSGSFLDEKMIDKFYFFFAPKWMGDPKAPGVFGGRGALSLSEAVRLKDVRGRKVGEDFLLEGHVEREGEPCSLGS